MSNVTFDTMKLNFEFLVYCGRDCIIQRAANVILVQEAQTSMARMNYH